MLIINMKTLLKQLICVSHFSYFCLGMLSVSQIISIASNLLLFILPISFISCSFLFKKKFFHFFLGGFIYSLVTGLLTVYPLSSENYLSKEDFESLKNSFYHFSPEREIKKNYWVFSITNTSQKLIVFHSSKIGKSESYNCPNLAWRIFTPELENPFFDFLHQHTRYYIQLQKQKCEVLAQEDLRFNIKKSIELALEKGGLQSISKDLALGLLLGDSSYLSKDLKQKAKEGGILHIFAASGLHLGILTGFIYLCLKQISFLPRNLLKLLPIFFAFFYLWLLQFPVSLTRAFCFILLWSFASLLYRQWKNIDLLIVTSSIIFLFDRGNFLSISFLLSFGAVFGIFFIKPILDQVLFLDKKNFFTELLTVSLSASIGTTPILLYYFQSYSFGSLFLNLLIIPITSFVLPLLYIALGLELIGLSLVSDFFWFYVDLLLRSIARISVELADKVGFYKEFHSIIIIFILFFFMIFNFLFLFEKLNKTKKKFIFSILGFLNLILFFVLGYLFPENFFLISSSQLTTREDEIQVFRMAYFVRKQDSLYLGGDCMYLNKQTKHWILKQKPKEIHVEQETCLSYALSVYEKNQNSTIYTYFTSELSSKFSHLIYSKNKFPKSYILNDMKYIIYFPNKDPLSFLLNETKQGSGKIFLFFSRFSRDSVEDWNKLAPLLGISKNWVFVSAES